MPPPALPRLARGRAKIVALVVDPDDRLVTEIAEKVRPDYIQAHGSEAPERIAGIARLAATPVIKAIKVRAPEDVAGARAYRDVAEMILFDAKAPETLDGALPGGNGIAFDWSLLSPDARPRRFMLSGGLERRKRGACHLSHRRAHRRCILRGGGPARGQERGPDPEIH